MRVSQPGIKLLAALLLCLAALAWLMALPAPGYAGVSAQIPTGSIATVTGTPVNALVVVLDNEQGYVNLRAGPNTVGYEIVGMLTAG
ncbi:MAG: hypothetical protein ACKOC5_09655, partial [Chloroflexota bacterium]